jgi:RNA recognition motif-containing protein
MDETNSKLFVGNLSYDFESAGLQEALEIAFSKHGAVIKVEIPMNKMTGKIKGIAFVTMSSASEAEEAKNGLDGYELGVTEDDQYPRAMRVDFARPMQPRSEYSNSGGRGGNRGGYNNNRGGHGGGYRDDRNRGGYDSDNYGNY